MLDMLIQIQLIIRTGEMKLKSKKQDFKTTKNEWYVKETGRRRRKATPIVREGEGSSLQPKKKQKKAAQTLVIDEPEEDNPVVAVEKEQVVTGEDDPFNVDMLFDTDVLETGPSVEVEAEQVANVEAQKGKGKVIDDIEGDDVDKDTTSSSSSSDEKVVDETERRKRIQEEIEKEKLLRKRKRQEKDDDVIVVKSIKQWIKVNLDDVGDFDFANTSQLRNAEKKVDEVVAENKKLAAENKKVSDREKILEMRVKKLESDNKELVKKIDSDQSEIDILKVRVAELEEEKTRRDEQNEYFKLKNKELEAAKKSTDHEFYMLSKVVERMLGTSVEQKFEELQVEEIRAQRQAEMDKQMQDKGKGVKGSSVVLERSIVPSMVVDNPEPISAISGLFEDDTPMNELIGDSDEDDEEEDEEEDEKDEKVFSASCHGSDDDDDDAAGGTSLKVTEASTEKTVDDLMNDSVNEESGEASGKGESSKTQIVEHTE
ncbi:glutamic acid-rich protein-like [Helianthus annuus]|uniref:glutamic acid-rich protein-like n=1 Tax=Helianthus annuus TaxID=4232 RepID=UPI000B907B4B|nr:glutamic acid-rich protein-like [Helianthus annuus]